jgi:glycosyltransferase involved in cell wall biosynthesis
LHITHGVLSLDVGAALQGVRSVTLHITHGVLSLDVGGLERLVVDLSRAAKAQNHSVSVVCLERPGVMAPDLVAAGVTVVSLNKPPGRHPSLIATAVALFREIRPDILHTHQIGALWYLGRAARDRQIPVLHTEHGNPIGRAVGWLGRLRVRLFWNRAARFADRFCCVSSDIATAVTRWGTVPRSKVEILLNGIDVDPPTPNAAGAVRAAVGIPATAQVIGTVGRLTEVKRQDLLLRATAGLCRKFPDLHLLVVGDGPERTALATLAVELGISDRVRWAGYRPDPERYLAAMDVFALTSRSEGLPLSLLEAWAVGKPVVCSAVGGIPSVVTSGHNGLLFPSGDVGSLTAALSTLLSDTTIACRIAQAGQILVRERFSFARMAAEYESRYLSLMASGGR